MSAIIDLVRADRWIFAAVATSLGMLAGAHAFEIFGKMAPCPLCLRQREVYWAAIAMAATGWLLLRFRQNERFRVALNILLGLVFTTGAVVALYHAGVEWRWWQGPAGCSATGVFDPSAPIDIDGRQATVSCLDAPWRMAGLSMAGWNALVSAGLAVLSFVAARRPAERRTLAMV